MIVKQANKQESKLGLRARENCKSSYVLFDSIVAYLNFIIFNNWPPIEEEAESNSD